LQFTIHHIRWPYTRARGGRAGRPSRIGRGCAEQSDRLEPPWAAQRLLVDVAISF
jgi:hypothetical protein